MRVILALILLCSVSFGGVYPYCQIIKREGSTISKISGVVIENGVILTCAHMVQSGTVDVEFHGDGEKIQRTGSVVFADEARDLAIVEVDTTGVVPVPLGDERPGKVKVIGFPGTGSPVTITGTIVDAGYFKNGEPRLEISFLGQYGMSGGPVIQNSKVIGIQIERSDEDGVAICASRKQIDVFLVEYRKRKK